MTMTDQPHEYEFGKRLNEVCDVHEYVPPKHSGRLTWVQRELESRYGQKVSVEAVRKWFSGESRPRTAKLKYLAMLLDVDAGYLSTGDTPNTTSRDRTARDATAAGVANIVAGLIQMDGGHVAFPDDHDADAKAKHVHLFAMIRGGKYDIHVSLGEAQEDGLLKFPVPAKIDNSVVVIGVVRRDFNLEIFELSAELVENSPRQGMLINVTVKPGDDGARRLESFAQRL